MFSCNTRFVRVMKMSVYTKSLSELGTADVQELLQDGAVENARLEFKLEVPNKDETLKKLSSFANTFGGFMIVGAKASSTDGRSKNCPVWTSRPDISRNWCSGASTRSAQRSSLRSQIRFRHLLATESSVTSCM